MKIAYLSVLFMACALSAEAQGIFQFADPGFEGEWTTIIKEEKGSFGKPQKYTFTEPGNGWHSFGSAGGDEATGFNMSASPKPQSVEGYNSNSAVKLTSQSIFGIKANGNLTTGKINMGSTTPTDPSNYNYSEMNGQCLQFAGIPDAVKFYAKFNPGKRNNGAGEGKPAGRGQFILHKATTGDDIYKDPENDDLINNYRVAIASVLIDNTDNNWHLYRGEFNYDKNLAPETRYMLASFTTNPNPGESGGDELTIDDVYFVYYSDLKSLTYDDLTFEGSALSQIPQEDGKVKVDLSSKIYNPDNLIRYELNGKGATAELGEFDKLTSTITLTVYGDDYGQNINGEVSDNKTVYVLQFAKPEISKVTEKKDYNSLIQVYIGKLYPSINTVSIVDAGNGTVNFTMQDFQFMGKPVGDITLKNAALYYGTDGLIHIIAPEQGLDIGSGEDPIHTTISLEGYISEQKDLNADVSILWLQEGTGIPILVHVSAAPFNTTLDGTTLTVTGDVAKDLVSLVVPSGADVNAIDLTGANLESEMATSDFGVKNSNTLFYVDAEETNLTGDNVVKGTECDNLVLTDGLTFNAPEGFTATNVTFNREFKAGNLSTVVLPFSFETANVNGTVYKLESVDDGVLSFKSVEGTAEANVPYLVQTEGDNLFKTETPKNVIVAQTPETVENRIAGTGVTHVGNFGETMEITSGDQTSWWYGYNKNGSFVKVNSGTIKPFRTAIKSTSATTQNSFALKLDGTVTGILNLENPNAKVDVYTISGVCVRKNVPAASALNGLSRGVYIVGGQKVVK